MLELFDAMVGHDALYCLSEHGVEYPSAAVKLNSFISVATFLNLVKIY
jgi:hypothetical protein